ncbi:hypothetical protein EON65_03810 [archaeon]|nr:MAG: hypothetical protein EON65_03810 [archaeon]
MKPAHKKDEELDSGSDTETESEEDEDTVSALVPMGNPSDLTLIYIAFSISSGLDREPESSALYDQSIFEESDAWHGRERPVGA